MHHPKIAGDLQSLREKLFQSPRNAVLVGIVSADQLPAFREPCRNIGPYRIVIVTAIDEHHVHHLVDEQMSSVDAVEFDKAEIREMTDVLPELSSHIVLACFFVIIFALGNTAQEMIDAIHNP